jgi:archaeal type IV pilus assembly protein PilA
MTTTCRNEMAVSPVIGVMLMLVVTVIVAAVLSGVAGGMMGGTNQKAPTLAMDIKIINMGTYTGSGFFASVTGVSEPINTGDLKIVTSWKAKNQTTAATVSGGNTTIPGNTNVNIIGTISQSIYLVAPFGAGPGINGTATVGYQDSNPTKPTRRSQQFGNYTLMPGTALSAQPAGQNSYSYLGGTWGDGGSTGTYGYGVSSPYIYTVATAGTNYLDPISALLGPNWPDLRAGDVVNVKFVHIPTGKVIFNKDITVTEG